MLFASFYSSKDRRWAIWQGLARWPWCRPEHYSCLHRSRQGRRQGHPRVERKAHRNGFPRPNTRRVCCWSDCSLGQGEFTIYLKGILINFLIEFGNCEQYLLLVRILRVKKSFIIFVPYFRIPATTRFAPRSRRWLMAPWRESWATPTTRSFPRTSCPTLIHQSSTQRPESSFLPLSSSWSPGTTTSTATPTESSTSSTTCTQRITKKSTQSHSLPDF